MLDKFDFFFGMSYFCEIILYRFSHSVFFNFYMLQSFGCQVDCPLNTGYIIIRNSDVGQHKLICEAQALN